MDAPFEQKFRRLGTTGRCLEDVTIKIFMGEEEMPGGEVRRNACLLLETLSLCTARSTLTLVPFSVYPIRVCLI